MSDDEIKVWWLPVADNFRRFEGTRAQAIEEEKRLRQPARHVFDERRTGAATMAPTVAADDAKRDAAKRAQLSDLGQALMPALGFEPRSKVIAREVDARMSRIAEATKTPLDKLPATLRAEFVEMLEGDKK
jgi:hypothetical protein